ILGPVMSRSWRSSGSVWRSLGTNSPARIAASSTGWRPSRIESASAEFIRGRTYPRRRATAASANSASNSPTAAAVARIGPACIARSRTSVVKSLSSSSFSPDQRLLALVVRGHPVEVGFGHLDVIAEDLVVADLERGDVAARALGRLQPRDNAARV